MLTAETITDEQIRKLQESAQIENNRGLLHDCRQATFNLSLGYAPKHERDLMTRERRAARARCAEILNARNGR